MGTYQIPRNYKGESRILYIFTVKSLISTAVGAIIGVPGFLIFRSMNMTIVGAIILGVFALLGFVYGGVKIPNIGGIPATKLVSGEPIGDIVTRFIKFRQNKKVYMYIPQEEKTGLFSGNKDKDNK